MARVAHYSWQEAQEEAELEELHAARNDEDKEVAAAAKEALDAYYGAEKGRGTFLQAQRTFRATQRARGNKGKASGKGGNKGGKRGKFSKGSGKVPHFGDEDRGVP